MRLLQLEKERIESRKSMDPFEVAFEDVEELPPDSPTASSVDNESQFRTPTNALPSPALTVSTATNASTGNNEDDDEEEEEDNVDINIRDMAFKSDPDKAAKTQ